MCQRFYKYRFLEIKPFGFIYIQKTPNLKQYLLRKVQCNLIFRRSEMNIHVVNYACMSVQLNQLEIQTQSAAEWPPNHLCYRPAVFFRYFRLAATSLPQEIFRRLFEKKCTVSISVLLKKCVSHKLYNVNFRSSESVCIIHCFVNSHNIGLNKLLRKTYFW